MPESLGRGLRAFEPGSFHHPVYGAPAGHSTPGPEAFAAALVTAGLPLADAVHQVEGLEESGRHRHGAEDARAALLQAGEDQHAGGEVDPVDGERQRLGEPAAGIGEGHAERAHRPLGPLGCREEGCALAGGDIFAGAVRRVEPQARGGSWAGSRAGAALAGARGQSPRSSLALSRLGSEGRSWLGSNVNRPMNFGTIRPPAHRLVFRPVDNRWLVAMTHGHAGRSR